MNEIGFVKKKIIGEYKTNFLNCYDLNWEKTFKETLTSVMQ